MKTASASLALLMLAFLTMGAQVVISGKSTHQRVYTDYCADASTTYCARFNENQYGKAYNEAGGNTPLVITGATFTASGKEGGAYDLENTSDGSNYLIAVNDSAFDFTTSASLSFAAWIKPEGCDGGNAFSDSIFQMIDVGANDGWGMAYGTADCDIILFTSGGNTGDIATGIGVGAWHHVAGTWDQSAGDVYLYVDGAEVHSDLSYADTSAISGGDGELTLGCNATNASCMDGVLDEVIHLERILTAAEIKDIYENGLR